MTSSADEPANSATSESAASACTAAAPTRAAELDSAVQPPPLPSLNPPSEAVPLTDDGGVYKLLLTASVTTDKNLDNGKDQTNDDNVITATPNPGDHVTLHWVGRYFGGNRDGEVFGSTRGDDGLGEPVTFKLDNGETLKAMERCLPTMRRGEICRLFARCDYAYGDETDEHGCCGGTCKASPSQQYYGCAGPGASVAIDIELLDWRGADISAETDGSLLRSVVRHGEGFVSPTLGSLVTVQLRGCILTVDHDPDPVEFLASRRLEFELGDTLPQSDGVCPGVEAALCRMFKGELAGIWLNSPYHGFGADGCPELGVPPNARLVYRLELLDFVKPKEVWQLSRREKLIEAEVAKARSVACLAAGNLRLAHVHCKRVVDYLEWDADFRDDAELQSARNRLLTAGRLNLALVCLRTHRYQQAASQCSAVLEQLDPASEKALYRRGQARLETCDFDLALADFRACLSVNPSNSAARAGIEKCHAGARAVAQRERRVFAGMFDRFAKQDAKGKLGGDALSGADFTIDTWDNRLADGMLSIPQELEAFGEEMPQKKRAGGSGGALAASAIVEADEEK